MFCIYFWKFDMEKKKIIEKNLLGDKFSIDTGCFFNIIKLSKFKHCSYISSYNLQLNTWIGR